jgi:hypothetical protein
MDSLIDSIIDMLALTDANRTNESGCRLFIGWSRGAVEVHDRLNLAPWTQEIAWCDEYRHVWVSVFHRCTLTYCEGDLTLSVAPDAKSFYNDLATAAEFYEKN